MTETRGALEAVIFDLDGTLVDSLGDIADAMNRVLEDSGFPQHDQEAYKRFVGDGMEALVRRALPADVDAATVDHHVAAMRAEYAAHPVVRTRPYPGIPELLDALTRRGLPRAILTNKPHQPALDMVARLLGRWSFGTVCGARDSLPRKPDPAGALAVAGELGVAPGRILYLGDTDTDMRTARAAGMVAAGVLWGFRSAAELRAHGADVLLAEPAEALTLLAP